MLATRHTFTYKTVSNGKGGHLALQVDVHVPNNAAALSSSSSVFKGLPVVFWIHGGGLLQSNRGQIPAHFLRAPDRYGLVVVSPDYRVRGQQVEQQKASSNPHMTAAVPASQAARHPKRHSRLQAVALRSTAA